LKKKKQRPVPVNINDSDIPRYVENGKDNRYWYSECETILLDMFGGKARLAAEMLAATSINTSLPSNVKLFRKAWVQFHEDTPFTGYLPNIQAQLQQMRAGQSITGQKICAFRDAMCGDENAIVVDIWIARAFKVHKVYFRQESQSERSAGVSKKLFNDITLYMRENAHLYDMKPREMCSSVWAGIRRETFPKEKTHYRDYLQNHFKKSLFDI
jgi:hypothetical protein